MPVTISNTAINFPSGELSSAASRGAYKNLIMNGDFRVHQRVTPTYTLSDPNIFVSDGRFFDRWRCFIPAGRSATLSRMNESVFPGYYFRRTINTVTNSASTEPDLIAVQWIDGETLSSLNIGNSPDYIGSNNSFTVSFWVRSSITGYASVAVQLKMSPTVSKWAFVTYYIERANVWEKKVVTFFTTKSYGATLSSMYPTDMYVYFVGYGGAYGSSTVAPGANEGGLWDGQYYFFHDTIKLTYSTPSGGQYIPRNTNFHNTPGATFDLSRIQLENGAVSILGEYEFIPYALELRRCQRFFQKSYPQHIAPGTSGSAGANIQRFGTATNWSGYYPVQFRGGRMVYIPSVRFYDLNGNSGYLTRDGSHFVHFGTTVADGLNQNGMMVYSTDTSFPMHYGLWFHWTAFADY